MSILMIIERTILGGGLILLSAGDIRKKLLSNRILVSLLAFRLAFLPAELLLAFDMGEGLMPVWTILGGILGGLLFLPVALVKKDSIGMGDIKLFAVVGSYLGFSAVLSVELIALLLVFFFGLAGIVSRKMKLRSKLCLGPFITVGVALVILA